MGGTALPVWYPRGTPCSDEEDIPPGIIGLAPTAQLGCVVARGSDKYAWDSWYWAWLAGYPLCVGCIEGMCGTAGTDGREAIEGVACGIGCNVEYGKVDPCGVEQNAPIPASPDEPFTADGQPCGIEYPVVVYIDCPGAIPGKAV